MKILLYNPDNGVTRNFMPHLWMFLLQSITPPEHEVLLIDGNARPMNEKQLVRFIREQQIGLVGIGAMTRMIARDRKSTRLNSSHSQISYAVFCLKKKKKKTTYSQGDSLQC